MSFRPLRVTRIQHRRREYGAGKRAERGVERRDNDKRVVEGVLVGNYIDTGYLAKGATTRFAADFQFLDVRGQQRIFGARGTFAQGLYINGTAATGGKLAWNFMGTAKWVAMGASPGRLRQSRLSTAWEKPSPSRTTTIVRSSTTITIMPIS